MNAVIEHFVVLATVGLELYLEIHRQGLSLYKNFVLIPSQIKDAYDRI